MSVDKGVNRVPKKRVQKPFYIQEKYFRGFDRLVFEQKQVAGKNGPALAEEALSLLFEKYGIKIN